MATTNHHTDAELLHLLTSGDSMALAELYERYRQPLYWMCVRILRDATRAEDAVHDTFIRLFTQAGTLEHPAAFRTWLFRVAHNQALMELRRRQPTHTVDPDTVWEEETPLSILEEADEQAAVQRLFDSLKPEYREVLQLREYEHLSYAEIAQITGDSESSVKSRIFKARRALAEGAQPWFGKRRTS